MVVDEIKSNFLVLKSAHIKKSQIIFFKTSKGLVPVQLIKHV